MAYEQILFRIEDRVGLICLNRPEKLNALTAQMADEMTQAIDSLCANQDVGVIVVTGMGRAFCAGGDLADMVDPPAPPAEFFDWLRLHGNRMIRTLHFSPKPTIASVGGPATGAGFNIALACDMILASSRASFGQVFVRLGLHPDCGGTFFLPRRIGTARACELIFTGEIIPAEKAYEMGIVNRVVPPEQLEGETRKLAAKIAYGPPIALALAKGSIYKGMEVDLDTMLRMEGYAQSVLTHTKDYLEGVRAFKEKRMPKFTGS